jgi:hypothetical protein
MTQILGSQVVATALIFTAIYLVISRSRERQRRRQSLSRRLRELTGA